MESLGEVPVALVEKGKGPGSHLLSGAMMNPSAMRKLFPDLDERTGRRTARWTRTPVYLLPNRSGRSRSSRPRRRSATTATT